MMQLSCRTAEPASRGPLSRHLAPDVVRAVLASSGEPLPADLAGRFAPRLGYSFGSVRVHADTAAAASAEAVQARAFTVGSHIVFGQGQYEPSTQAGRAVLAHELVHVAQQNGAGAVAGPLPISLPHAAVEREADALAPLLHASDRAGVAHHGPLQVSCAPLQLSRQPSWWARTKSTAYEYLIDALRTAKGAHLGALRDLAGRLPASVRRFAQSYLDVIEVIDDLLISIILAVIGIVVGFGEGVVGLVMGLVSLVRGILSGLYAAGEFVLTGNSDRAAQWWDELVRIVTSIPDGIRALVQGWLAEFERAPLERQQLMIGELTGQLLAIIASFYVAPSRAGSAGTVAAVSEAATPLAGDVIATAARAQPALRVIEGGGQAAIGAARAGGRLGGASAFEGGAARDLASLAETARRPMLVPPPSPVVPTPAPVLAQATGPLAAAGPTAARRGAAAAAAAAALATNAADADDDRRRPNSMRHQIQRGNQHYVSADVSADPRIGVTQLQLRTAMSTNYARYLRIARNEEALPRGWTRGPVRFGPPIVGGIVRQSLLVTGIVNAGGVREGGDINALRTCFDPGTLAPSDCDTDDVRLDVENQGHNLRS